jgi:surfeit locus 1 family protein
MTRRVWTIAAVSLLGIVILGMLGMWQMQRLHWKQALLANIVENQAAPPMTLDAALKAVEAGQNVEFRRVSTRGAFMHQAERHFLSILDGKPAWQIVTPLQSEEGIVVLVDRGAVPEELRDPATRAATNPQGIQSIIGAIRLRRDAQGLFAPDNDPEKNLYYWWDVPAMLRDANPSPDSRVALFVLQLTPLAGDTGFPRPQGVAVNVSNNHLQYAITWFSLAAVLVVFAGLLIRQEIRKPKT